jgi:hypothetical protein
MKQGDLFKQRAVRKRVQVTPDPELWASFSQKAENLNLPKSRLLDMILKDFIESGKTPGLFSEK